VGGGLVAHLCLAEILHPCARKGGEYHGFRRRGERGGALVRTDRLRGDLAAFGGPPHVADQRVRAQAVIGGHPDRSPSTSRREDRRSPPSSTCRVPRNESSEPVVCAAAVTTSAALARLVVPNGSITTRPTTSKTAAATAAIVRDGHTRRPTRSGTATGLAPPAVSRSGTSGVSVASMARSRISSNRTSPAGVGHRSGPDPGGPVRGAGRRRGRSSVASFRVRGSHVGCPGAPDGDRRGVGWPAPDGRCRRARGGPRRRVGDRCIDATPLRTSRQPRRRPGRPTSTAAGRSATRR